MEQALQVSSSVQSSTEQLCEGEQKPIYDVDAGTSCGASRI